MQIAAPTQLLAAPHCADVMLEPNWSAHQCQLVMHRNMFFSGRVPLCLTAVYGQKFDRQYFPLSSHPYSGKCFISFVLFSPPFVKRQRNPAKKKETTLDVWPNAEPKDCLQVGMSKISLSCRQALTETPSQSGVLVQTVNTEYMGEMGLWQQALPLTPPMQMYNLLQSAGVYSLSVGVMPLSTEGRWCPIWNQNSIPRM